jgi:hypothetical protein
MIAATVFGIGWLAILAALIRLILRLDRMFVETLGEMERMRARLANTRAAVRELARRSLHARRDRDEARRQIALEAGALARDLREAATEFSTEGLLLVVGERRRPDLDRFWCGRVVADDIDGVVLCGMWGDSETGVRQRLARVLGIAPEAVHDLTEMEGVPASV